MRFFLIGLPGSGKSHWAKLLGQATMLPVLDLDTEIEKHAGKTINEIFQQEGETAFRDLENKILIKICERNSFILACGGGTPCFLDNMDIIKFQGRSIYLQCDVGFVVHNLQRQNEVSKRPLFQQKGHDLKKKSEDLLSERKAFYEKADHIITIDRLKEVDILNQLKMITLN
ncbi:MAG: shikimate kinase [Marivirga sp.]|jgi:shikimate kinase